MSGVDGTSGAARRRQDKRLREWWRHEQLSDKAAVVSALHHSSGQCSASRRQKVDRQLGGAQPNGVPALSLPCLAQDDCLDHATVFLLEHNLVACAQGDGGGVSEPPVASLSPSPLPMSEVSWSEARWSRYLAHPLDLLISVSSQAVARVTCRQLQVSPTSVFGFLFE